MRRLRAWGDVPHALGRPGVTVRAHYGALPSMAGLGQADGGETCRMPRPRKYGPPATNRRGGAPEGVSVASDSRRSGDHAAATVPKARLSALRRPSLFRGTEFWQTSGASRRENKRTWLFENRIRRSCTIVSTRCVLSRRACGSAPAGLDLADPPPYTGTAMTALESAA